MYKFGKSFDFLLVRVTETKMINTEIVKIFFHVFIYKTTVVRILIRVVN